MGGYRRMIIEWLQRLTSGLSARLISVIACVEEREGKMARQRLAIFAGPSVIATIAAAIPFPHRESYAIFFIFTLFD